MIPRRRPTCSFSRPAGRGKSALLVRWYDELSRRAGTMEPPLEPLFVPVSLRYELSSEAAVFGALAARLSRLHGSGPPPPGQSGEALRDLASTLLCRPLPSGKRLLVLLDGLDEGAGWDVGPASFPHTPAPGVRAVFSARLTARRATPEAWLDRLGWQPAHAAAILLDPLDRAGVREVLERMGAPLDELAGQSLLIDELYRLTGGDPLLLGLYARDLWARRDEASRLVPSQLSEIAPGIEGYFDQWWRDQQVQWGEGLADKKAAVQIVFNLLATALGPLPRRDLLRLARSVSPALTGDALDDALETLARFVVSDSARQAYVLTHPRFAQYRYEKLAADGDDEAYDRLFLDWGRQTLESAERDGDLSGLSPYIVQRYGAHLARARRPAAERLRLVSTGWRRAWESHSEEHDGFLSDVERAWKAAEEADQAAVTAGQPPPFLADELQCALVTAEANASVDLTNASLLSALAAQGVWSVGRCLSFAFGLESPERQADALAALVPSLEPRHLAAVLSALDRLFDPLWPEGCSPLIAAVAVRLAELGDVARALALARARPGFARGEAIVHLAPHLSPETRAAALGEALDDAASYGEGVLYAKLVELLAFRVDRRLVEDGSPFRERLIALLDLEKSSGTLQTWRLAFAAPWLGDSERREKLRGAVDDLAAKAVRDHSTIFLASEIIELAPALDVELAEDLLVRCVDKVFARDLESGAFALAALFPKLGPTQRQEMAPRLLAAAPAAVHSSSIDKRCDFIARLAAAGHGDRALEVIGEQEAENWYTNNLIEAVVPFLDERQTRICLGLAEGCRPETRDRARSAVLGRLASFGSEQARETLALCHRGNHPGIEEAAAPALLGLFGDRDTAGPDTFRLLARIGDEHLRLAVMVQVAAFFGQLDAESFAIAVSSFGDSIRSVLAVEAIGRLVPYLTSAAVSDMRVIDAVERPVENVAHSEKKLHLTPYFERLAAFGRVREGLAIGRMLSTRTFELPLFCALVGLAGSLEGEELQKALEEAREIEDSTSRILALLALSARTEEEQRQALFQEAADHLASFDVGYLAVQSEEVALVLGILPEPIRRQVLPLVVTDALLRSGSYLVAYAQVRLIPFLPEEQVDRLLRSFPPHDSASARDRLRAALAVRLLALGRAEEGFAFCRMLSDQDLIHALQGMIAVLPPELLTAAVDLTYGLPGYKRVQLGHAFASRWKDLSRRQLLELVQTWLRRVSRTTRSDLLFDLVTFAWPLRELGGERAVSSVMELLREKQR